MIARSLAAMLILRLPGRVRALVARRVFGWSIHPSARIGLCVPGVRELTIGPNCRIGHFTVFHGLVALTMDESSQIGQWNWCSATFHDALDRQRSDGRLHLHRHSAITARHYLECTGGIEIGAFSTIGGQRSSLMTRQVDVAVSRQVWSPITIGAYCLVASDVKVTPGATIGDRIVVGMGAVVVGNLDRSDHVYAGVPAKAVKAIPGAAYFTREQGFVHP